LIQGEGPSIGAGSLFELKGEEIMNKNQVRIVGRVLVSAALICAATGCAMDSTGNGSEAAHMGELKMPLRAVAGEHTYVLSNVGLSVSPGYQWFSADQNERLLLIELAPGDYSATLESFTLNRELPSGELSPVEAQLVSDQRVNFSIFNDTTSTISFQFETDGQIVVVGTGELRVVASVEETTPICSPLSDDCGEGLWCAPSELTGQTLACLPAGGVAVGEECSSPTDCVANATCLRFGGGEPSCTALCGSEDFDQSCSDGGTCRARGQDYGVCEPERSAEVACLGEGVFLPLSSRSDSIAVDEDCMVYVASRTGELTAHDLWSGTQSVLASTNQPLAGIDLSPSGATLVSAVEEYYSSNLRRLLLVNRRDGSTSDVDFSLGYYERPLVPQFLGETQLWLSSQDLWGYSHLNHLDLESGALQPQLALGSSSTFALNEERTGVFVASTDGTFGVLDQDSAQFFSNYSGANNYEVAANAEGTVLYVANSLGLVGYDAEGLNSLWSVSGAAAGVVYVPESDVLVVSWVGGGVEIRAAQDGAFLQRLTSGAAIWSYGSPLSSGHLRASRGGRMVTLNVDNGVRVYPLPAAVDL
jgi:hypothetical protein